MAVGEQPSLKGIKMIKDVWKTIAANPGLTINELVEKYFSLTKKEITQMQFSSCALTLVKRGMVARDKTETKCKYKSLVSEYGTVIKGYSRHTVDGVPTKAKLANLTVDNVINRMPVMELINLHNRLIEMFSTIK